MGSATECDCRARKLCPKCRYSPIEHLVRSVKRFTARHYIDTGRRLPAPGNRRSRLHLNAAAESHGEAVLGIPGDSGVQGGPWCSSRGFQGHHSQLFGRNVCCPWNWHGEAVLGIPGEFRSPGGAMVFQQGIPRTPFAIVRQERMLSLELVSLELEWHPSTASSAARPLGQCHPPRSDAAVNL
jgi:hypothetical protein